MCISLVEINRGQYCLSINIAQYNFISTLERTFTAPLEMHLHTRYVPATRNLHACLGKHLLVLKLLAKFNLHSIKSCAVDYPRALFRSKYDYSQRLFEWLHIECNFADWRLECSPNYAQNKFCAFCLIYVTCAHVMINVHLPFFCEEFRFFLGNLVLSLHIRL